MSRLYGIFDENLILLVMSWLNLRDYGVLDMALTNVEERKRWMTSLSSAGKTIGKIRRFVHIPHYDG